MISSQDGAEPDGSRCLGQGEQKDLSISTREPGHGQSDRLPRRADLHLGPHGVAESPHDHELHHRAGRAVHFCPEAVGALEHPGGVEVVGAARDRGPDDRGRGLVDRPIGQRRHGEHVLAGLGRRVPAGRALPAPVFGEAVGEDLAGGQLGAAGPAGSTDGVSDGRCDAGSAGRDHGCGEQNSSDHRDLTHPTSSKDEKENGKTGPTPSEALPQTEE